MNKVPSLSYYFAISSRAPKILDALRHVVDSESASDPGLASVPAVSMFTQRGGPLISALPSLPPPLMRV